MEKEYFLNNGFPLSKSAPRFENAAANAWNGLNCVAEQSFSDHRRPSVKQFSQFDQPLSSMGPFPAAAATATALSSDCFVLRQVMGKLGGRGVFPPSSTTPPPPLVSSDPNFMERASKFSPFGSRSFNDRTAPFDVNNVESQLHGSSAVMKNRYLPRILSSPCLKKPGSLAEQMETKTSNLIELCPDSKMYKIAGSCADSNGESSVSEQFLPGRRKRKPIPRGKCKEDAPSSAKGLEREEDSKPKRAKSADDAGNEKPKENDQKAAVEPPKDYIHVRARRGQATDSHSLAERVRREKISERMKFLQDLVPGCNKVTGKALMLEEIINYVKSLQCQVEFLSMKLSSVNPGQDINANTVLLSKDLLQENATLQQQQIVHPLDPSPAIYNYQNVQEIDTLPSVDPFGETLPQFPAFGEDDLQRIVQMSYGQKNPRKDIHFPVQNQTSNTEVRR